MSTVLLLGGSGRMGFAAWELLWQKKDASGERVHKLVVLLRPSTKNKRLFAPYEKACGIAPIPFSGTVEGNGLKIVWGSATDYSTMLEAVRGVDFILCPMALTAPAADRDPIQSKAVNVTAISLLLRAIQEVDGLDHIKLVYVGSVAQYGDRLRLPRGRVGDPMAPSLYDFYGTCKVAGERSIIESGLKHWVSLRQTYIALPDVLSLEDPIMYHMPLETKLEFISTRDAGRGLVNCLDIPDDSDFWRRVYNMSGGPSCRITYREYLETMYRVLGLGDFRTFFQREWFALRNFHCLHMEDSETLNAYIHCWGDSWADYCQQVVDARPVMVRLGAALTPWPLFGHLVRYIARQRMQAMALRPEGTQSWVDHNNAARLRAFFGSTEAQQAIGAWDDCITSSDATNDATPPSAVLSPSSLLDHGYDESIPLSQLNIADLQKAAEFRGGALPASNDTLWNGDVHAPLLWRCARNHEFHATPYCTLKAGHWCPECAAPPWDYGWEAEHNPFFAQVWYSSHTIDEKEVYSDTCYLDIVSSRGEEPHEEKAKPSENQ